jgi:hypothetical protein
MVRPRNTVGRTVRCFPFEKRRTVRPAAFPGRTIPVSAFRTVPVRETGGRGVSCNLDPKASTYFLWKLTTSKFNPKAPKNKKTILNHVVVLIHTCKRGLSLNPLSVSSETQCLSSSPLSPRLELLSSRLTPREAKGGRP